MKKLYCLLLALTACIFARAQVSKGSFVLGGNLLYDNQKDNITGGQTGSGSTFKSNQLTVNPSIGKAIRDNLVLGLDIAYMHGNSTSNANGTTSTPSDGFTLGVFIRRYKFLGSGFALFGQAEIGGGYSHAHAINAPGNMPAADVTNVGSGYLTFYPGIAYALNRHWQIETGLANFLSISYYHSRETTSNTNQPDQIDTRHDFNLTSGLSGNDFFTVGVRYIIGGK
jgi:hypothetical protein